MEEKAIVTISGVCYTHAGKDILHNINLELRHGDFVSIIGPNGGGKTTLLKLILGLLKPTRGRIEIKGLPPHANNMSIGYVPQQVNHNLRFPATVLDVVLMGLCQPSRRGLWGRSTADEDRAVDALTKLGMQSYADRKIKKLSGGQRQRVLIARALVSQPELLVLDEPTASIDTKGQTELYELLSELNRELTILMVSHDLLVISNYAKSFVCLNRGMHYHPSIDSSGDLLEAFYSCSVEEMCPVGIISREQRVSRAREKRR